MKVLVLGDDGRAHALVWKLFSSPLISELICGPGNGGTATLAPQVEIDQSDAAGIGRWAFDETIDLIVPAAGAPLWAGLVDEVVSFHIGVCGPAQRTTRIEQSRCYAKELLLRYELPTAPGRAFTSLATAEKYLATQQLPVAIKADHPDAGEGVFAERYGALQGLHELFGARASGGNGDGVVIEAYLSGPRIAQSALTDGRATQPLLPVRIYDHLREGDEGTPAPGMGACTGTSAYAAKLRAYIHAKLIAPLVAALDREGLPLWGFVGIDTIITEQGPRITALRCALRDGEAQVVLPRLEDDLVPLIQLAIGRRLDQAPPLRWRDEASVGIGLVAQGYPHHFPVGGAIAGLTDLDEGVLAFHHQTSNAHGMSYTPASSRRSSLSKLLLGSGVQRPAIATTGGHVLTMVATSATANSARARALVNAERIAFPGRSFRADIGQHEQH
ncbi:MAG: phosphoribosylamine--glycine ligase [Chloroflexales bacterium]|nr:phosphoribosylamine--glycine ligase [Chloroflexales bacterium]